MDFSAKPILVGDIGGTNARFAIAKINDLGADGESYKITQKKIFQAVDYENLSDALHAYLANRDEEIADIACLGVAAHVHNDDEIKLTNSHWSFKKEQLRQNLSFTKLTIINDFHAMTRGAVAPQSKAAMISIRVGEQDTASPIAVLGPGTGLGLGIALQNKGVFKVIPTEGGHAAFAPRTDEEIEVLRFLRREHDFICVERLLSGRGLVNIHRALCALHNEGKAEAKVILRPDEITQAATDQSSPMARMAVNMFCAVLGGYAGDIAVTTGARGGVIIAGGIVPHIKDILVQSTFEQRFVERGAMSSYVEPIAVDLLTLSEDAALLGAALSAEK